MKNHVCLVSPAQSKKNPKVSAKTVVVPEHARPINRRDKILFCPGHNWDKKFLSPSKWDKTVLSPEQIFVPGTELFNFFCSSSPSCRRPRAVVLPPPPRRRLLVGCCVVVRRPIELTVVIGEESAMICGRQGLGQRRATIQAVALSSPAAACRYNALRWLVVAFSAKQKEQRTPPAANQRQHHHVYVYVSRQLGLILTYLQYLLDQF